MLPKSDGKPDSISIIPIFTDWYAPHVLGVLFEVTNPAPTPHLTVSPMTTQIKA